jgi:hypothetical protein
LNNRASDKKREKDKKKSAKRLDKRKKACYNKSTKNEREREEK